MAKKMITVWILVALKCLSWLAYISTGSDVFIITGCIELCALLILLEIGRGKK